METALISGCAGFLGSHLVDALLEGGHRVIGVDNLLTGRRSNLAHLDSSSFTFVEADVNEARLPDDPVDWIFHLACPASPRAYRAHPFVTLRCGSDGTRRLLEHAEANEARLFLASTSEVYGEPLEHPQSETYFGNVSPTGPRSMYDEAKRFSEALAIAFHRAGRCEVRIGRLFNTYGPRMRPDDGRVVPSFCSQALSGRPLTIHGTGKQTRSYQYVSDTIAGILAVMEADEPGPFNVGNPQEEHSVAHLAERILALSGGQSTLTFEPRPEDDPSRRRPDIARVTAATGWVPQVDLDDGLRRTLAWFRKQPL